MRAQPAKRPKPFELPFSSPIKQIKSKNSIKKPSKFTQIIEEKRDSEDDNYDKMLYEIDIEVTVELSKKNKNKWIEPIMTLILHLEGEKMTKMDEKDFWVPKTMKK